MPTRNPSGRAGSRQHHLTDRAVHPEESKPAVGLSRASGADQDEEVMLRPIPHHVKLARGTLREAGFRPLRVQEIGNYAWIECLPPADARDLKSNYDLAGRASVVLRRAGFNVGEEDIKIAEIAGRVVVLVPVRLPTERVYKPPHEMLTFRPLPGGGIGAETPFSNDALLNTWEELVRLLLDVKKLVHQRRTSSPQDLANRFAGALLAEAADLPRWEEWHEKFKTGLTAKNAALVLLEDTTGLQRGSLTVRLSRTRTAREKSKEMAKSNHG